MHDILLKSKDSELTAIAAEIRRRTLKAIHHAGTGHEGPSLSLVEILTILLFEVMDHTPERVSSINRDFLIVSKGHGSPGLYAALARAGFLPDIELDTLRSLGSRLQGHPCAKRLPCIDFSTGSLGQGFSAAVGIALGLRLLRSKQRTFAILGDGELQEGQVWEAAMSAPTFALSSLCVIVDRNGMQSDGSTEGIMPLGDLVSKWRAFGWDAIEVDGHNFQELRMALTRPIDRPRVIIAKTVKGKGVSFMEGAVEWHHKPLDADDLARALKELEYA
jgi:transketolase